jgi:predicted RNase H-like HicB family nuclease
MRYSVFLEPVREPEFRGYYYAHVPALDLTTHGQGIEGAVAAARELLEGWIAERRAHGEAVPVESDSLITHIEVADALFGS